MSTHSRKPILDIFPWPHGQGFTGRNAWWEYVLIQSEKQRLDFLLLAALLSSEVCELLLQNDKELFDAFDFSKETIALLSQIHAKTLDEFASELLLRTNSADF